jgi:hypothetical protein
MRAQDVDLAVDEIVSASVLERPEPTPFVENLGSLPTASPDFTLFEFRERSPRFTAAPGWEVSQSSADAEKSRTC